MNPLTIAGIDPGTARIGYAVLRRDTTGTSLLTAETIAVPPGGTTGERLAHLAGRLRRCLRRDRPDAVAVEKLYFSKNVKTALSVAEARGIILLTAQGLVPSICEYAPLEVKLAVAGYGGADKAHVRRAVHLALPREQLPEGDDAIDAIAIALAAIYTRRPAA